MEWTGGCLCGAVRYRADADPVRAVSCHCGMCRRASGAAFLTFVHFPRHAFVWSAAEPARYRSSPEAERGFCPHCGSTLTMHESVLEDRVQVCLGKPRPSRRRAPRRPLLDRQPASLAAHRRRPPALRPQQLCGALPRGGHRIVNLFRENSWSARACQPGKPGWRDGRVVAWGKAAGHTPPRRHDRVMTPRLGYALLRRSFQ